MAQYPSLSDLSCLACKTSAVLPKGDAYSVAAVEALECSICLEPLGSFASAEGWADQQPYWVEACRNAHGFHTWCLARHIASRADAVCPECRAPLLPAAVTLVEAQGREDTAENEREASHLDRGVCDTREKERARGGCGRRGGLAMGDR